MRIDVHTHFIPEPAIEAARAGDTIDGISLESKNGAEFMTHPKMGMRYPLQRVFFDRDAKLEHMNSLGIDLSILSIVPLWLFHWTQAEEAEEFCRMTNDWLSGFAAESDRLVGMATVPLQSPDAAAAELRRCATELGLRGVEIGTTVNGVPLDDERFAPFFEAAEELGMPIMIHPCYSGKPPQFQDFYMKNLVGNPLATAVAATRMMLSGFLDRHPGLEIILVHAGGYMPFQVGRLDHGCAVRPESGAAIDKPPSEYLRRFHYDTITHAAAPLGFLVDLTGHERVVLGTDIPFDMGDTEFERILDEAGLTPEAVSAIERGNAERLFRIA
ncbi:MAG TPA: amidohydrolase family protein [Gammaproteobacteria bacterium]